LYGLFFLSAKVTNCLLLGADTFRSSLGRSSRELPSFELSSLFSSSSSAIASFFFLKI
jgi:hypothetical protein